jgi:dicarboxylate/amino acid:cation (Na+ or H+) symporter, DAACS family
MSATTMPGGAASAGPSMRSLWTRTLPLQMLGGLVVGCIIGLLYPDFGKQPLPLGQAFIKALRMIVIPLVFSSIALGIYNMGREIGALGRIVGIAFGWFFFATGVCIVCGLVVNGIFHPGIGADLTIAGQVPKNVGVKIDLVTFLLDLIPVNVVAAMAEQRVLQVLLFGILFGASLATIGPLGRDVARMLEGVQRAMMHIVRWVIVTAPIAIAGVMAWLFSSQGAAVIMALAKLVGALYVGLVVIVLCMWLVLFLIGYNPLAVTRKLAEPLLLAFTTRSSETTLPIHMEILERMGTPNKVVSTVIPLGYSFNQDGTSLYISLAVAFVIEAHHINLDWPTMLTIILTGLIATKGMGNVGGGGLVAATTVLVALGMPLESVAILAAIDVFLDMGRTTVNVFGNTVAVLLVNRFGRVSPDEVEPDAEAPATSGHV